MAQENKHEYLGTITNGEFKLEIILYHEEDPDIPRGTKLNISGLLDKSGIPSS